jgi:hypothetical protein
MNWTHKDHIIELTERGTGVGSRQFVLFDGGGMSEALIGREEMDRRCDEACSCGHDIGDHHYDTNTCAVKGCDCSSISPKECSVPPKGWRCTRYYLPAEAEAYMNFLEAQLATLRAEKEAAEARVARLKPYVSADVFDWSEKESEK